MAQELAQRMARPVIIVSAAVAGSPISDWNAREYSLLENAFAQRDLHRPLGLKRHVFVWIHGEIDAEQRTAMMEDKSVLLFLSIVQRVDGALNSSTWPILQATKRRSDETAARQVRAALQVVVESIQGAILFDTDKLGERCRYDGCDFNENGRREAVRLLFAAHVWSINQGAASQ
jgi:hypothetical protein